MTDQSDVAKLRRAALNLLARRDYSRHEMANKLLRKAALLQQGEAKQGGAKASGRNRAEAQAQIQAAQKQYDDLGFDNDDLESDLGISISASIKTDRAGPKAFAAATTATTPHKNTDFAKGEDPHLKDELNSEKDTCVDISHHVEPVLDWLTELNFLNDNRFVEAYIRYGIGRGHGLMRIRQDLQRKGIEQTLLADALESLEADWFELAADLRQRRFGVSPPKSEQKERARQMRFLQYRGFSLDQCFYALSREPDNDH